MSLALTTPALPSPRPLSPFPLPYTRRPRVEDDSPDTPSTFDVPPSTPSPVHNLRARPRPPLDRYSPAQYGFSVVAEPTSYQAALTHPEWQPAMAQELAALERSGTWDLVSLPSGIRPITCKWVYKIKTRSDGSLDRYK